MDCSTPDFFVLHYLPSLLKLMSNELVMPSNHVILCHPFSCPQSFPKHQNLFQWIDSLHQVAKDWSFSFSISSSSEYSGLISFRIDWFDLLALQGTLESLLQHHSWKVSVLWHSIFLMVQLSYLYMCTRKTIALTKTRPLSAKWCLCFLWLFYIWPQGLRPQNYKQELKWDALLP